MCRVLRTRASRIRMAQDAASAAWDDKGDFAMVDCNTSAVYWDLVEIPEGKLHNL